MAHEVLLDTNVILRYALADDPLHQQQARRLFEQAGEGKLRLLVPSLVIAQVVWTLESFYRASREYITGLLEALLATPNSASGFGSPIPDFDFFMSAAIACQPARLRVTVDV